MDSVAGDVMSWGMMQRAMCETLRRVESVLWCVVDGEGATGRTRMKQAMVSDGDVWLGGKSYVDAS